VMLVEARRERTAGVCLKNRMRKAALRSGMPVVSSEYGPDGRRYVPEEASKAWFELERVVFACRT
jgi:hypothetical protein